MFLGQIETHLAGKLILPDGCHRFKVGVELGEDGQRHLRDRRRNKNPEGQEMEKNLEERSKNDAELRMEGGREYSFTINEIRAVSPQARVLPETPS